MIDDRRRPVRIVSHPAWDAARTGILTAAKTGRRTVVLIGPPGTGKSLLLRSLATDLGTRGLSVMHITQGDLPFKRAPGSCLLIDEASRIPSDILRELLVQQEGTAVLGDVPAFLDTIKQWGTVPELIRLRPLTTQEVGFFAEDWLQAEPTGISLTKATIARLAAQSEGVPRLIVQLLAASLTVEKPAAPHEIAPETVDEMAVMRLNGLQVEPEAAPAPDLPLPAARSRRPLVAAAALAVAVVLAIALYVIRPFSPPPGLPPLLAAVVTPAPAPLVTTETPPLAASWSATLAEDPPAPPAATMLAPEPITTATVAPSSSEPPPTSTSLPAPAPAPAPASASASASAPAPSEPPPAATNPLPPPTSTGSEPPPVSTAAAPSPTSPPAPASTSISEPTETAATPAPTTVARLSTAPPASGSVPAPAPPPTPSAPAPAPPAATAERSQVPVTTPERRGGPGFILVARAGDTLRSLYNHVYRGLPAPPFTVIEAANPQPLRPGAMVIFPAPAGGWPNR